MDDREGDKLETGSALNALSPSPDGNQVVVAGRDVLKVLEVVDGSPIREVLNMRVGKMNLNFSSNDVRWCPIPAYRNLIATAATNGAIVTWDLSKNIEQKQVRVITEHQRVVNRICFHSQDPVMLLSASQDGTVKLWDLRHNTNSASTFECRAESVRDVKFNPADLFQFASAHENGVVQTWDMRSPSKPLKKITAHSGPIFTVDWQPSGKYLATGSRDKLIKIWDIRNDTHKPHKAIQSILPVNRVEWRPSFPNQIASAALIQDFRIHIWDLQRIYVPLYCIDDHTFDISALIWRNSDTIWSCSKNGLFTRAKMTNAFKPENLYNTSASSWNVQGDLFVSAPSSNRASEQLPSDSQPSFPNLFRNPGKIERVSTQPFSAATPFISQSSNFKTNVFDSKTFVGLAEGYILEDTSEYKICEQNAEIAEKFGALEVAQSWKILKLLYTQDNLKEEDSEEKRLEEKADNESLIDTDDQSDKADLFSIESEKKTSTSDDESHENENINEKFEKTEKVMQFSEWDHSEIVKEMLEYYANLGDVQTCATILVVLGKKLNLSLDHQKIWFFSYIELLHRFKLWNISSKIISMSDSMEVKSMSQEATTIYMKCNKCMKALDPAGRYSCTNCKSFVSQCSLCHETVKGTLAWCQECGHGGHLSHMREWFRHNKECPSGCGHMCSF